MTSLSDKQLLTFETEKRLHDIKVMKNIFDSSPDIYGLMCSFIRDFIGNDVIMAYNSKMNIRLSVNGYTVITDYMRYLNLCTHDNIFEFIDIAIGDKKKGITYNIYHNGDIIAISELILVETYKLLSYDQKRGFSEYYRTLDSILKAHR